MIVTLFTCLSVLSAIELIFLGSVVSYFFPPKMLPLAEDLFDLYKSQIIPERDVLFFHILIVASLLIFVFLIAKRKAFNNPQALHKLKVFISLEFLWVLGAAFSIFKLLVFREILFFWWLCFILAASLLSKVFWPEVYRAYLILTTRLRDERPFKYFHGYLGLAFVLFVGALIWVPDAKGALAKMFIGEQFHHMDWFLMPPAWAHAAGNVLCVDTQSRYGIGAPVFVAEASKLLFGRLDYLGALWIVMGVSVLYYGAWFFILKQFFHSIAWSALAVLLGLRLQFFHGETMPFIFTYPQMTPMRYFFDSIFFCLLAAYTVKPHVKWLYGLGVCSGVAIYWVTGEGLYITCAYLGFLFLREAYAYWVDRSLFKTTALERIFLLCLPFATAFVCFWATVGGHVFSGVFWNNMIELMKSYGSGQSSAPMMNNLVPGFILEGGWAFLFPAIYVFVLLLTLGLVWEKRFKQDGLLIATACIYLLADFHYQALVSNNTTAYLRMGIIIALIAIFWLKHLISVKGIFTQRVIKLSLCGAVLFALLSNHQYLRHPNIFNFSKNPMCFPPVSHNPPGRASYFNHLFVSFPDAFKLSQNSLGQKEELLLTERNFVNDKQLREFYTQEIDYSKDARLIARLTGPKDKVPLISSFEVPILIQANRRPFFYLFQMINSRPRRMRNFTVTLLYTNGRLKREIDRVTQERPPYVFMEKIFLSNQVPASYMRDNQDLIALLNAIFERYEPYQEGEYLVALKRKE